MTRKGTPKGVAFVWGERAQDFRTMTEQGMSQREIGEHYGVSPTMIYAVMRRYGIRANPRTRSGANNPRYKHGREARGYRKVITKDACARCGGVSDLGIHHKNDDHYDNREENLEVLCNSCHMSITKKKWWDAVKRGEKPQTSNAPIRWGKATRSKRGPVSKGMSRCVLNAAKVAEIRARREQGESLRVLAESFGVAQATIHAVVTGRSWNKP